MLPLLEWLASTPVAGALKRSAGLYIALSAAHIFFIGLLVGAIVPLDLRVLGLFRSVPLATIGPFLARSAGVGAGLAIMTGVMLFTVRAVEYAGNVAFLAKLGLIGVGLVNAWVFERHLGWGRTAASDQIPVVAKLSAIISLATWCAAVVAGRWIGFL